MPKNLGYQHINSLVDKVLYNSNCIQNGGKVMILG